MSGVQDAIELIELYFQRGWTDGLPVIEVRAVRAVCSTVSFLKRQVFLPFLLSQMRLLKLEN
jgi:hypothetical protein